MRRPLDRDRSHTICSATVDQHVTLISMSTRPAIVAALILMPLLAPLSTGRAQQHTGHGAQIEIPRGAAYTVADVEFMQGMIAHHAQAIFMTRMAESHRANPRVRRLAAKIDQSQVAEIRIMQDWLRSNGQHAPDTSSWRTMTMPGMLTAAQLQQLDSATGAAFDRLFLELMIQHHEGAIQMVKDLFATPRAGQEIDVNVFANDVVSVQTAEIGIMRRLLSEIADE
jgi:uncharacterized protein (DUF305 family)